MADDEDSTSKEQAAKLRRRALEAWIYLSAAKAQASFHLYEKTNVKGTFVGTDSKESTFLVEDLTTPLGVIKEASIRGSDVLAIKFSLDGSSS